MNKLRDYIDHTVMHHINDVRTAFEYCTNMDDVNLLIGYIPFMYGSFDATENEDSESFTVTNMYDDEVDTYDFEFYTEED